MVNPRSPRGVSGAAGWALAGVALLVTTVAFALPRLLTSSQPPPAQAEAQQGLTGAEMGPAPWVDLTQMSPEEAAERLFLRVMRAASTGDEAEVRSFHPMAMGAFAMLDSLDSQATFRVALLQQVGGMFAEAYQTLTTGLASDPSHLLLLGGALELSLAVGDTVAAGEHARRLLDSYESEIALAREEYQRSAGVLSNLLNRAESVASSGEERSP